MARAHSDIGKFRRRSGEIPRELWSLNMPHSHDPKPEERAKATSGLLESLPLESLARIASLFWALPSLGAVVILWTQPFDPIEGATGLARLEALRIEHWLALVILLIQAFFTSVWITETLARKMSRRQESPKSSEDRG